MNAPWNCLRPSPLIQTYWDVTGKQFFALVDPNTLQPLEFCKDPNVCVWFYDDIEKAKAGGIELMNRDNETFCEAEE